MVVPQAPDADGRIVHEVQPYQMLITISEAYRVPINRILELNAWREEWPLQIGQKLIISPGNITPSPTLSSIQRLTPAADGRYYHSVQSGETLSWIAGQYEVSLADLLAWNGLTTASVIIPGQKLLLQVTPPATATATQAPSPTAVPSTPRPSITPSLSTETLPIIAEEPPGRSALPLVLGITTILLGGLLWWGISRRKRA